jgi:hypothetical protein
MSRSAMLSRSPTLGTCSHSATTRLSRVTKQPRATRPTWVRHSTSKQRVQRLLLSSLLLPITPTLLRSYPKRRSLMLRVILPINTVYHRLLCSFAYKLLGTNLTSSSSSSSMVDPKTLAAIKGTLTTQTLSVINCFRSAYKSQDSIKNDSGSSKTTPDKHIRADKGTSSHHPADPRLLCSFSLQVPR